MKKILFTLLFISMASSQFDNSIQGWYNDNYYVPSGSVYSEGLIVADESTLAAETLDEVDFATNASWVDGNDWTYAAGVNVEFVWTAWQTSDLEQLSGDFVTAAVGSRWYVFTYTIAVTTAFDGDGAATITTTFALAAVDLNLTAGTHTVYFKSAAVPGDFVISVVSGSDTEGTFTIDDVTLKEITGGDIYVAGNGYVGGDLAVGASSASSAFHIKAGVSGLFGQIIIQNPANNVTANAAITAYESDVSGDPDQQLWYLGNSSGGNSDVCLLNKQNSNLDLGTNSIVFFKIESDGDMILFNGTAGKDFTLTFDGETNDGIITYMEDEDRFDFDNAVNIGGVLTVGGYTRHIDIEIGAATLGPNAPIATSVGTFRGFGFDADNEEAFVNFEIPADWDGVSDMAFELHWYPTAGDVIANGETVKWDATYRSIAAGEAVDNGTVVSITATFTGGASEIDKEDYETVITIDYDNVNQPLAVNDDLGIQFDRDVTTDTYSGAGIVYRIDLTYTSNTLPDN